MCFDVSCCPLKWIVFSFFLGNDRTFWCDLDDWTRTNLVKIYLGLARSELVWFGVICCGLKWFGVIYF